MSVTAKLKAMLGNERIDLKDMFDKQASATNSINDLNNVYIQQELKSLEEELNQIKASQGVTTTGPYIGHGTTTLPGMTGIGGILGLPPGSFFPPLAIPPPLTPEEEVELKDLEVEHRIATKKAKLDHFKQMPREFRQSIINVLIWEEAVEEINAINPLVPERMRQLQSTKQLHGGYYGSGLGSTFGPGLGHHSSSSMWPPSFVKTKTMLPEGITKEELMEAHMDASLEEELQSGPE